jgi:hypothetical protein
MMDYILHQQEKSRQKQLLLHIALRASNSNSAGEIYKTMIHLLLCVDLYLHLRQVLVDCPQKASGDKIED